MNFFEFIAEEVREHLAALGFRSIEEAIGHVEMLDTRKAIEHWKAQGLDLSPILAVPVNKYDQTFLNSRAQDHGLDRALDNQLIADAARRARGVARRCSCSYEIRNVNRTVGTMLGSELTRRWGGDGLPDGMIDITFRGSAGQSFGAFVPRGDHAAPRGRRQRLLRQGTLGRHARAAPAARGHASSPKRTSSPATSSSTARPQATVFIRGVVGERFCVRNSGATAVVEGVGDHGCEYMTGGRAVILGPTGRNFAAGMSGGFAYVYDPDRSLYLRCNTEMVDLDPLDDEDVDWLRGIGHHAHGGDRFGGRGTHPVQVVAQHRFVHQDLPEGLQARARSAARRR